MVATLDLCLTFVECDSTANFHELQEVYHDCVKCREMASGRFSVELTLNCDPSKCNCVCISLHNESRSESFYEAACLLHKECGSSRKSGDCANRYVVFSGHC